ncbi:MAG: hypothetical protein FWG65_04635 [Turicibacter sp.]|nr:hypothetical protein [Turicibacter sp.]
MFTQEHEKLMRLALKKWGKDAEVLQTLEELAELSKELLKNVNRGGDNRDKIVEEMGDVYIMLEQLKSVYAVSERELAEVMGGKLARLGRLIKEEK